MMVPVLIKLEYSAPPLTFKRDVNAAQREAFAEGASRWHDRTLPKHFDSGASARYDYAPRTPRYDQRKFKKKGHRQPLVWSGALKRAALRSARVTSTSTSGTVRFGGGVQALNVAGGIFSQQQGKWVWQQRTVTDYDMFTPNLTMAERRRSKRMSVRYPNLPRELTAISDREVTELGQFVGNETAKRIRRKRRLGARS